MTLTTEQTEKLVRLKAKFTMLNNELRNTPMSNVTLKPTLDLNIASVNRQIASYANHAGMTRENYVTTVQPLKNHRRDLIQQNENVHQENNILKQAAQQQHETDMSVIQQQIDANAIELLNAIETVDLLNVIHN